MLIQRFFRNLFKKDRAKILQKERERLKTELRVLDKLKKELENNYSKD